jgi:hypothetical protein
VPQDLQGLLRRRLFELGIGPDEAARRSRGSVNREMMSALLRGAWTIPISDRLARVLARVLQVSERRVRRAAGLPVAAYGGEPTRPHLRVVRKDGDV